MIFTDSIVKLQHRYLPPKFYSTTITSGNGGFTQAHCLIVHEQVSPSIIEQSVGWRAKNKDYGVGLKKNTVNEAKVFVPVVICVMTKSNYVDLFRNILETLYISLVRNGDGGMMMYGSLEFLNSTLFLVSEGVIPPFDTEVHLQIQKKCLKIPVESFTKSRHNESCVSLIFDLVDIKSIIRFWEAAVLNKHLFVVCSNEYLLYSVLEAIKILIFPMRWDFNIIPVLNPALSDYMGSVPPIMIGINSVNIEKYNLLAEEKDDVVLNIDTGTLRNQENNNENLNTQLCKCKFKELYNKLLLLKVYQKYNKDKIIEFGLNDLENFIDDTEFLSEAKEILSDCGIEAQEELFTELIKKVFFGFFQEISNIEDFIGNDSTTGELIFNSEKFLEQIKTCGSDCKLKDFWVNIIDGSMTFQIFLDNYNKLDQSYMKRYKKIVKKSKHAEKNGPILVTSGLSNEEFIQKFKDFIEKVVPESKSEKFQHKIIEQIFKDLDIPNEEQLTDNRNTNFSNLPENIEHLNIFYGEFGVLRSNKVFLSFLKPEFLIDLYSGCSLRHLPNVTWDEILVSLSINLKRDESQWDLDKILSLIIRLNGMNTKAVPNYYTSIVIEKLLKKDPDLFEKFKTFRGRLRKIINWFDACNHVRTVSISSKKGFNL